MNATSSINDNAFRRWMDRTARSPAGIAIEFGLAKSYVYQLLDGTATPGRRLAIRIQMVSQGKVTIESWDE